jgi:hypothetical protein
VHAGNWQASARELEFAQGSRFDHLAVNGVLSRVHDDVVVQFTDLQVTRGARLERAPRLSARLSFEPASTRVARTTLQAERVPFMAAEFLAGVFAPQLEQHLRDLPTNWSATAGELRAVRFDSVPGSFSAQLAGAEITRDTDRARVGHLAATIDIRDGGVQLAFDPSNAVLVWIPGAGQPRTLRLGGELALRHLASVPRLEFTQVKLSSGDGELSADGVWGGRTAANPLSLEVANVDRALLADVWSLLELKADVPQLADVQQGVIVAGQLQLLPVLEPAGTHGVNWQRSRGTLTLANVASLAQDGPQLSDAAGKLEFSRGNTQLRLTSGRIDDLQVSAARIDWPRQGPPRLQAGLRGNLQSPLLQRAFAEHGLERLAGTVVLDAEARGEPALRDPRLWRLTARISDASIPLAADLPPVQQMGGTLRYADGQLRTVALEGSWLGGPVKLESRRSPARAPLSANISGVADAAPLLRLLGQTEAAGLVNGQLAWSGVLQRLTDGTDTWQVSLNSNLVGVESRLPEPFGKTRPRQVAVHAELRLDARGIREYDIASGGDAIHGRVNNGVTIASFQIQGMAGELHGADSAAGDPRLRLDLLELRRAPLVLAAAGALLPADGELVVRVAELRHANRGLGALQAGLSRRGADTGFTLESAPGSPHDLSAAGTCVASDRRCTVEFTFDTRQLPALLAVNQLPPEWPAQSLRASGELSWDSAAVADITRQLSGRFELETQGAQNTHELVATAQLAGGQIELSDVRGSGPEADQVFRGKGRIGLLARTYDLTVDYERVSLAATAMPSPARAGLSRAWSVLRGTADRRDWTDGAPPRRVQWHGTWD